MSAKAQKQLGWIYGLFLTLWLVFSLGIFSAMLWPVHVLAQQQIQKSQYRRNLPQEPVDDIYRRIDELESWRRQISDPQREQVFIRLERIEAAEGIRDKVVIGFVIPVLLILGKEVAGFLAKSIFSQKAAG